MTTPKKFLNDPTDAVSELITGLLYTHPTTLQKLSNHNVLLTNPIDPTRVNILSGGGSGHEPSHAGWISPSMLSGAILGGIFASPSVSSILAGVRAVTTPGSEEGGCLLIVKNYTGDRLNFGMACEMANAEGRKCEMVVVADDCALPRKKGVTGSRGVAGTVFVHKVAGGAAAEGKSLGEVAEIARVAAGSIGSLGVALDSVTVPGATQLNDRLSKGDKIEIGLGIHGEAGIRQSPLLKADEVSKVMVDTIWDFGYGEEQIGYLKKGDDVAVMINNLGGTSNFEMGILAKGIVEHLEKKGCNVTRVYVGAFMTSFDMRGASTSVFYLDKDGSMAKLLDAPCDAPAWTKAEVWTGSASRPSLTPLPEVPPPPKDSIPCTTSTTIPGFSDLASQAITSACEILISNEPKLTEWDTIVGDGDCGMTLKRGATAVQKALQDNKMDLNDPHNIFIELAEAVSNSMGGTSGILLELMFRKSAASVLQSFNEGQTVDKPAFCQAFVQAVEAVSFYGGAKVGSRTMLDALVPASEIAKAMGSENGLKAMAQAATHGAESTKAMREAAAGRSNYLSAEQLDGTPDPGAMAMAMVVEALANVFV